MTIHSLASSHNGSCWPALQEEPASCRRDAWPAAPGQQVWRLPVTTKLCYALSSCHYHHLNVMINRTGCTKRKLGAIKGIWYSCTRKVGSADGQKQKRRRTKGQADWGPCATWYTPAAPEPTHTPNTPPRGQHMAAVEDRPASLADRLAALLHQMQPCAPIQSLPQQN
jgi:hypothetical protein